MRRIILSIILGFLFPLVGLLILGSLYDFLPRWLTDARFYGRPVPGPIFAPFMLPGYLFTFLNEERIAPALFDTFWYRSSSFVLFNWVLYSVLGYFILGRFKWFKKHAVKVSDTPPSPPKFE